MTSILVMLNNYMHDFATALVVVCSYAMLLLVRYAEKNSSRETTSMVLSIYPKMLHLTAGSFIFLILAGVVRSFTYENYEWAEAAGRGQIAALMIKHVLLFILFGYGIYLWVKVYRRVKALRKTNGKRSATTDT
jgi:uncharacterized membrane protein